MRQVRGARRLGILGTLIGWTAAAGALRAAEPDPAVVARVPAPTIRLGDGAPVADERLSAESAKAQIQLDKLVVNEQELNGSVHDNVAIGNQNGGNTVSGDAFGDATGFVTVIQNSGNNVLIQNSTIVNVALEP